MFKRQTKELKKQKNPKKTWQEIVDTELYNQNLEKLLQKISIQNRYSNRVTISNVRNLDELQRAKEQITSLRQQKQHWNDKNKRELQLRQKNQQLNKQIEELKYELERTAGHLIKANKQIKKLKKEVKELQEKIIGLQMDNFAEKNNKLIDISSIIASQSEGSLANQVKNFLMETDFDPENVLVSFCRKCYNEDDYDNFFKELDQQISLKLPKNRQFQICPRLKLYTPAAKTGKQSLLSSSLKKRQSLNTYTHGRAKTLQSIKNRSQIK